MSKPWTCKHSRRLPNPNTNTNLNPYPNLNPFPNCQLSCENQQRPISLHAHNKTQDSRQRQEAKLAFPREERSGRGAALRGNLSVCENETTNCLSRARHQNHHPSQWHIETKVPAIQAEQTEFDVAPVTPEYVPAKASDEEYG